MKSSVALQLRSCRAALRAMVVFTVVIGVGYTAAVTAVGQVAFPEQANGSLVRDAQGEAIGSAYIGQSFTDADGNALPQYFQSRPSATTDADGNAHPYDGASSGGSNLGASDKRLTKRIEQLRESIAQREGVEPDQVPADAVTASASGLDYQISPAYADIQVARVAQARGLEESQVRDLVKQYTTGRGLGFIGEPGVNVLKLNTALDALQR